MHRTTRIAVASMTAAAAIVGLAGCASSDDKGADGRPLTEIEACVTAHPWSLDASVLADNLRVNIGQASAADKVVTSSGTQTLTWDREGYVTLVSDLKVEAIIPEIPPTEGDNPNPGRPEIHWTETIVGESGGRAFFWDNIAVPRDWSEDDLVITESAREASGATSQFRWPQAGRLIFDDTVGLIVTCTPDELIIDARGNDRIWRYTPAS